MQEAVQCAEYTLWGWIDQNGEFVKPKPDETDHGEILERLDVTYDQAYKTGWTRFMTLRCDNATVFKYKRPKISIPAILKFMKGRLLGGEIEIEDENEDTTYYKNQREAVLKLQNSFRRN